MTDENQQAQGATPTPEEIAAAAKAAEEAAAIQAAAASDPYSPQPVFEPAPEPSELGKIGGAKIATFLFARRTAATEYVTDIRDALREQFLIPADTARTHEFKLGNVSGVAISFPTAPGAIDYDVLSAYLARALENLA
jgi:hypothetical protein